MKDIDRVSLTYNDSQNPGRVVLAIEHLPRNTVINLSAADAVALADRLLTAVRSEGYNLTAKKRAYRDPDTTPSNHGRLR